MVKAYNEAGFVEAVGLYEARREGFSDCLTRTYQVIIKSDKSLSSVQFLNICN